MTTPAQPPPAAPQQPQAPTNQQNPAPPATAPTQQQTGQPAPTVPQPPPVPAPPIQPSAQPAPVPTPPTWQPPVPPQPDDGMDGIDKLPQKWQKTITNLRAEAAKYRTSARSETVLRHAYATAGQHGVDGDALLGSVAFTQAAASLDPNAEDFPAQLAAAVQNVLTANPWMAAQAAAPQPAPIPATSGGQFPGAPGAPGPSLDQQIAEAEKNRDFRTAIALKRLRSQQAPTQ